MTEDGPRWLEEREMAAWRAYISTSSRLLALLELSLMRTADVSAVDYGVLVGLSEAPDGALRMSELSDAAGVGPPAMTYRVARMEKKGLVERRTCPEDRRGVLARITPAGRRVLEQLAPVHLGNVRKMFIDRLDAAELEVLADIFGRLADVEEPSTA